MSDKNHNKSRDKTKNKKNSPANQNKTSIKRNRQKNSSPESTPPPPKKITATTTITAAMSSDNVPLTIDVIRALLNEQTNSIQNCLRSEMKVLSDEIKAEFQTKITQLNDKIDKNQANVQSQINDIKSNVDQCMEQANDDDDDIKRIAKLNELKISGVSYTNGENLNGIFELIAQLVKFDMSNAIKIPTLTRITKRDRTTNITTPTKFIIAKFVASHIRNEFYSLYLNKIAAKEPIMTENLNLSAGTRIIIGENLTAKNSSIFIEASKLKKQGTLCQVFTQDGLVHVKAIKTTKAKTIRSQKQLELFTLANPPNSNQQAASNAMTMTPITTPAAATSGVNHIGNNNKK